jgi:cytochrome oxidase Cu insertion factor (SCO1/SenC/PrrC family)
LATALTLACEASGCAKPNPRFGVEPSAPVTLVLRTADAKPLPLAALRGQRVLLFIFTTYDDVSQLALTALEQFLLGRPKLEVVGVAVQPDPQRLLPLYRDSLGVSFELAFDPNNGIVAGGSELGEIETIPTYIVLDARGRIVARYTGALEGADLQELVDTAAP